MLLAERIASVPSNQLFMHKQVLNSVVENSLESSQRLATLFDGITRNSPEGIAFQRTAEQHGLKDAVKKRDTPGRTEEYRRIWRSVL
jgi:enoyl-CoA hydratase